MFTFPTCHSSGGDVDVLDSVISSVCCDLDATISASYGGSGQTWANLIASPADGAAQTDYDFFLGADGDVSTDDPTFTGTAGSNTAYWAMDGGDDWHSVVETNPPLMNIMHRTSSGSNFWIAAAFRFADGGFQMVFSNMGPIFVNGVEIFVSETQSGNGVRVNIARSGTFINNNFATGDLVDGTDYLLIVSGDTASTDDLRVWLNTTTAITDTDMNTNTSSADASELGAIASRPDESFRPKNGTRYYHFSMGNEYLDDTKAALIFSHLETRHSKDYTP